MKRGQKATVVGMVLQHNPGCLWVVHCGGDVPKAVHWILQDLACSQYSVQLSSKHADDCGHQIQLQQPHAVVTD